MWRDFSKNRGTNMAGNIGAGRRRESEALDKSVGKERADTSCRRSDDGLSRAASPGNSSPVLN